MELVQAVRGGDRKKLAVRFEGYFWYASHLKQSLNEAMGWDTLPHGRHGPPTHRQYMAWMHWRLLQWNEPDRHDHYLMKVVSVLDMRGGEHRFPDDYRLGFDVRVPSSQEPAEPVFLVDGKPFGPRRLTKADVERLEQQNLFARVAAVKPSEPGKQTQAEMSRQIEELIKHNEQVRQGGGNHRVTPHGVKPV